MAVTNFSSLTNWWSEGLKTGLQAVNTILADSGILPQNAYKVQVNIGCTVAGFFQLQWIDVDDVGVETIVQVMHYGTAVSQNVMDMVDCYSYGHRIRLRVVVAPLAITGSMQAMISQRV